MVSMSVRPSFAPRRSRSSEKRGYDAGAKILTDFFKDQIKQYLTDDLDPLGRQIIECCLNDGTLDDYLRLTPM